MRRLIAVLTAVLAVCLAATGCGGSDSTTTVTAGAAEVDAEASDSQRVVIEAEDGAFDPRAIYEAAAPGVVTVTSVFDGGGGGGILGGGGPSGGQGAGFVISDEGEILTNAHSRSAGTSRSRPRRSPWPSATPISSSSSISCA